MPGYARSSRGKPPARDCQTRLAPGIAQQAMVRDFHETLWCALSPENAAKIVPSPATLGWPGNPDARRRYRPGCRRGHWHRVFAGAESRRQASGGVPGMSPTARSSWKKRPLFPSTAWLSVRMVFSSLVQGWTEPPRFGTPARKKPSRDAQQRTLTATNDVLITFPGENSGRGVRNPFVFRAEGRHTKYIVPCPTFFVRCSRVLLPSPGTPGTPGEGSKTFIR